MSFLCGFTWWFLFQPLSCPMSLSRLKIYSSDPGQHFVITIDNLKSLLYFCIWALIAWKPHVFFLLSSLWIFLLKQNSVAYLELGCGLDVLLCLVIGTKSQVLVKWPFPVMAWLLALGCFQQIGQLETHKLLVNYNSVEQFHWKNSNFSESRTVATVANVLPLFNRAVYSDLKFLKSNSY